LCVSLFVAVPVTALQVAGARPAAAQTPATGLSPSMSAADLLSDPSFEQGLGPWVTAPGQNRAIYNSSSSGEGGYYLETNSGTSSSPSLYQDASVFVVAGHSYGASVLLRSPTGTAISASLVIWATGGSAPTEVGQTQVTVRSATWARYYTDVDVADSGHSALRVQLYLETAGQNLDVDGAMLQDAAVGDAGFAQGLGPWQTSAGQNRAVYSSSSSPDGQSYLETNSGSSSSPTLYQDVPATLAVGHTYVASVFLRSPTGAPVSVNLDLWALGGSASDVGQTQVTVSSSTWTRYYTDVDLAHSGHSDLRLQLYVDTPGQNLDFTGARLEAGGVADSCFDQSGLGPWAVSAGANASIKSGPGAPCGANWLETNTNGGASSSLYEDMAASPVPGHPYTASVLMRSTTGGPVSVSLVLWATGGSAPTEVGQTQLTVGSSWTDYSTVLDVAHQGHTGLRLQLYLTTSGQTLAVDAATAPDLGFTPPTPSGDPYGSGATGYDISWPQCGAAYPAPSPVAIVGVNDGSAFSTNPCFASEAAWGGSNLTVYLNLNSPQGSNSSQWGQGPAGACALGDLNCESYNYGYNTAESSVYTAVASGHGTYTWWLDVETGNYWTSDTAANDQVMAGAVAAIHGAGYQVAIYSTNYQWGVIAGNYVPSTPVWYPTGIATSTPYNWCSQTSFAGGPIYLVQRAAGNYDGDYSC
jgi:Carbohydrate binding domain